MDKEQNIEKLGDLTPKDFLRSVGICRFSSDKHFVLVYSAINFCVKARTDSYWEACDKLEGKGVEVTESELTAEQVNIFNSKSQNKISSLDKKERGIFRQMVDYVGMDDCKPQELREILDSRKGIDKEGVNLFGEGRINLIKFLNLGREEGFKEQFQTMVKGIDELIVDEAYNILLDNRKRGNLGYNSIINDGSQSRDLGNRMSNLAREGFLGFGVRRRVGYMGKAIQLGQENSVK